MKKTDKGTIENTHKNKLNIQNIILNIFYIKMLNVIFNGGCETIMRHLGHTDETKPCTIELCIYIYIKLYNDIFLPGTQKL